MPPLSRYSKRLKVKEECSFETSGIDYKAVQLHPEGKQHSTTPPKQP